MPSSEGSELRLTRSAETSSHFQYFQKLDREKKLKGLGTHGFFDVISE
jgi:hypothetical protein